MTASPMAANFAAPAHHRLHHDSKVSCSDCEAVCCRLTVLLMPEDVIPARLVAHDEHGLETMAKGEDGWCKALDPNTMRCSIYARRPQICRRFVMGGPYCHDERAAWHRQSATAIPIVLR